MRRLFRRLRRSPFRHDAPPKVSSSLNFGKLLAALLLLFVFLPGASAGSEAETANYGYQLFDVFLRGLNPQSAVLQLREVPRDDGFISWAYLECHNANVRGMNVRSLKMDCFDAEVTPPARWKFMEYPAVKSMLSCHAEGVFTEDDINDFLRRRVFGSHKEWEQFSVKLRAGRIEASAYYKADLKLFKTRIRLDLSCAIAGRGTALWLEDIAVKVNDREISPRFVEDALKKLQPFIDMKNYNLPLYLTKIEFSDGTCRVRSRILPKPLPGGLLWQHPDGCEGRPFRTGGAEEPELAPRP